MGVDRICVRYEQVGGGGAFERRKGGVLLTVLVVVRRDSKLSPVMMCGVG